MMARAHSTCTGRGWEARVVVGRNRFAFRLLLPTGCIFSLLSSDFV